MIWYSVLFHGLYYHQYYVVATKNFNIKRIQSILDEEAFSFYTWHFAEKNAVGWLGLLILSVMGIRQASS